MKIITICEVCGTDFMYDPNFDTHLFRSNMPLNAGTLGLNDDDLLDHDDVIVICQECNDKESAHH